VQQAGLDQLEAGGGIVDESESEIDQVNRAFMIIDDYRVYLLLLIIKIHHLI